MIMKKKIVFALSLLLMFSTWGKAQQKQSFDLEGAKKQAIQYNRMLKNSAMAIDKAQYQLKEAISGGLPQISSKLDYTNALGAKLTIRFDPNAPATEIPIKPSSQFNLQVGQLLFNGSYFVGLELAKLGKTLTEKNYEKTEQDVLAQVTGSYYLVLVSGELLNLMNKNTDNLKEVYRKTEAMVNVGMLEKTDLDQLSVQIAALENAVSNSGRQLEMARNMFRLQLGMEANQDFELSGSLEQVMGMVKGTLTNPGIFDISANKDYQLIELQEQMSQKQVKMQNAAYLPTLTGFYSRTEKIIKPNFDMSPKDMVGANLSIPIFSGGQRKAKVDQAKIDLETMRNTRAFMSEQLQIQERQLQYNLKSANETWLNQVRNLEVAKSVYANLKRKFEQGMISGLELVSADNNYVKAQTDYISSVFQVLQATVELDKINGKLK